MNEGIAPKSKQVVGANRASLNACHHAREPDPEVSGLKIVVISDALRDRNGVDAYYRDLVSHLRRRVALAELLNPNPPRGGRLERLAIPLPGDRTQKIYIPNPRHLLGRLREIAPHAVVVATPGPFGLAGLYATRRLGAGLIAGFHTDLGRLVNLYWSRLFGVIASRYLELCHRILFRYAQLVVANSDEMVSQARALGASAVEVVGTPIARPFLETDIKPLPSRLGHVLYAGRLAPEKNVRLVIEAAGRLPRIRFSIAGEGPLADTVSAAAARLQNLNYIGWIPRARLVSLIDSVELLALPSQIEAFGTVAVEAMARGRPVLVSKHCGILEWPRLAEDIYHVHEHEHLAHAIDRIARVAPATRARSAERGRGAAMASNDQTLNHWLSILSRVAGRAKYA